MFRYLRKYWPIALCAALFMVGEVLVDLYQPRMMERIVNIGILGIGNNGVPDLSIVTHTGIRMILIVMLGGTCGVLCGVLSNVFGQNFGNEIRKACFDRVMHFSFEQTDAFSTGSLITRITGDVTYVQNLVMQFTRGMVRCLMFLIAGSIALMSLDLSFRPVIMAAVPLILLEVGFIVWKTNPLFTLLQQRLDRMNSVIQENIAGARVVKAFVQEEKEKARFGKANEDLVFVQMRVLIMISIMRPFMNIVLNLAILAILHIGAGRVSIGAMAPGTLMAGVSYITMILNGMMMLAMIFQTLSRGFASGRRLKEVLDTVPALKDGSASPKAGNGTVEFDHVSFHYPGTDVPVLKDISLSVRAGEFLAVIGSTGSGPPWPS